MRSHSLFRSCFIFMTLSYGITSHATEERFTPLDAQGAVADSSAPHTWQCTLDRYTGLTWELKTAQPGLHFRDNTYSWHLPQPIQNGGDAGQAGDPHCSGTPCDTWAFVQSVNRIGWCGFHDWRLPQREELRSLVDYTRSGPTLDTRAFPNAVAQFYWAAESNAINPEEAWGIGFAFGFDYAYFKTNRVRTRLVRGKRLLLKGTP